MHKERFYELCLILSNGLSEMVAVRRDTDTIEIVISNRDTVEFEGMKGAEIKSEQDRDKKASELIRLGLRKYLLSISNGEDDPIDIQYELRVAKDVSLNLIPNGTGDRLISSQENSKYYLNIYGFSGKSRLLYNYSETHRPGSRCEKITSPYHCSCMEKDSTIPCTEPVNITALVTDYITSEKESIICDFVEVLLNISKRKCRCGRGQDFVWDMTRDPVIIISYMEGVKQMFWREVQKAWEEIKLTDEEAVKIILKKTKLVPIPPGNVLM